MDRGVAHVGARLPKLAKHRFWVTTSLEFATLLHGHDTSEGDTEHLAPLSHRHKGLWRYVGLG